MAVIQKPGRGWVAQVYVGAVDGRKRYVSRSATNREEAVALEAQLKRQVALAREGRPAPGPASGNGSRKEQQRRREGEVIRAAIDVFWARGYPSATIADVAERVGMLKGSLYHYIDSKEDLLIKIFETINVDAVAILQEAASLEASPLERLRYYLERYLGYFLSRYEQMSLYFTEWRHLSEGQHRKQALAQRVEFDAFVSGLITEAQGAGEISSAIDPKHATFFILGAVNSVSTWYRREGPDAAEVIAASYARMTIGLLTGTAGPEDPATTGRRRPEVRSARRSGGRRRTAG